jgi:hypothetical protein
LTQPEGRAGAHLILGPREEPFLEALLLSLEGAVGSVIVNDNSPEPSPHRAVLEASSFARAGTLLVDRTPFADFSTARNICLRLHAEHDAGDWVAFVDADEVHGEALRRYATRLASVPAQYDFIDGYTWHFFGSFDWYTSIERRMMFFRFDRALRWEGAVHERLAGLSGRRLVVPYVYGHYGHVLEPRRYAEKGRLYSSLGAEGEVLREDELDGIDAARFFAQFYPQLLRFRGPHPVAARATIERLRSRLREHHALTDRLARAQPLRVKAGNALMKLNYEQRWRGRALNGLARRLATPPASMPPSAPT